ncbi:hypothetical protein KOR42_45730 [Thalassoglobus neptunius]|uniref:Uncharacterized protein n=1 Tax=Thalassoglobus neptunius TaxID=1938619 RepID=A0A5C5VYL3_9PLAN|nr:hypothetical protein KOR42_45730 [Thalassoglobus neptunius]
MYAAAIVYMTERGMPCLSLLTDRYIPNIRDNVIGTPQVEIEKKISSKFLAITSITFLSHQVGD